MKYLKGLLVVILSILLYGVLVVFNFSISLKGIFTEQLLNKVISNEISNKTTVIFKDSLDNSDVSDEKIDQFKEKIEDNKVVNDIVDKFVDDTFSYLVDGDIDNIKINEDIIQIIKENKNVLEEEFNVKIDDDKLDEAVNDVVNGMNVEKYYKDTLKNTKKSLTNEQKLVLKFYNILTSDWFKYVLIGIVILITLWIAIIQWSLYKWIKTLSISFIISSIFTVVLSFVLGTILNLAVENITSKITINVLPLFMDALVDFIIGIVLLISYIIIEKKVNKKKNSTN